MDSKTIENFARKPPKQAAAKKKSEYVVTTKVLTDTFQMIREESFQKGQQLGMARTKFMS